MKWYIIIIGVILLVAYLYIDGATNSPSKTEDIQNTYEISPFESPTDNSDRPTFEGYPCTDDCSGHEAGYDWASEKGITDPDDCGGNSESFIEGCREYAEEYIESSTYESDY